MKRTHVFLPELTLKALRAEAKLSDISVAEIIRHAISKHLAKGDGISLRISDKDAKNLAKHTEAKALLKSGLIRIRESKEWESV